MESQLATITAKVVVSIVDEIGKILRKSRIVLRLPFIQWEINTTSQTIDERIEKLDDAKEALTQGLAAIDELHGDAKRHKKEVQKALLDLNALNSETEELEAKKESIAKILESEVSAFQDVAGIPSASQQSRDKILGFISGVIASLVASGLIYFGALIYQKTINNKPEETKVEPGGGINFEAAPLLDTP